MQDELIGRFAWKKRGFYSHITGLIQPHESPVLPGCKYKIVYKSGHEESVMNPHKELYILSDDEVSELLIEDIDD